MKRLTTALVLLLLSLNVLSQKEKLPFWNEIKEFKKQDSIQMPPSNAILFIGSSSFRLWKDMQNDFPGYTIINRGFGGSTLPDQIPYLDDIVFPYNPKQIVIFCGENDIASSDTITPKTVFNRFQQLFTLIRAKLPNVPIAYVSMKPSPSRQLRMPQMRECNEMIKSFLKKKRKTVFIDIYKEMIDDEGKPIPSLFLKDNLHMNKDGYAIWQRKIQPYLVK